MRISSLLSRRSARRSGLTLIEILVVSVIFAIIALSLFVVFRAGLESWSRTQAHLEVYQTARTALDWMTRDFSAAYLNSNNTNIVFRGFASGSPSGFLSNSAGSEAFFIAALNPTQNDPNAKFELCKVGYWKDGKGTAAVDDDELMRFYYTQTGSSPDYAFAVGMSGTSSKVAKNVTAFTLTFFDSAGTQTSTWDSRAGGPSTQVGKKPSKVQISLTIKEPNSTKTQTFTTGVYIPQ